MFILYSVNKARNQGTHLKLSFKNIDLHLLILNAFLHRCFSVIIPPLNISISFLLNNQLIFLLIKRTN